MLAQNTVLWLHLIRGFVACNVSTTTVGYCKIGKHQCFRGFYLQALLRDMTAALAVIFRSTSLTEGRSAWDIPKQHRGKKICFRGLNSLTVLSLQWCGVQWPWHHIQRSPLRLDALFRKLCRSIVAPPWDTDGSLEWHDVLHDWNIRVQNFIFAAAIKPWSRIVCKQH